MKWFTFGWLAATAGTVACMISGAVHASECADRFRVALADGNRACLTDFNIADEGVRGRLGSLQRLLPGNGFFSLAATPQDRQCRRGVGVGSVVGGVQSLAAMVDSIPGRNLKAMAECAEQSGVTEGPCACRVILVDGRSPLGATEFASYAGARGVNPPAPMAEAASVTANGPGKATGPGTAARTSSPEGAPGPSSASTASSGSSAVTASGHTASVPAGAAVSPGPKPAKVNAQAAPIASGTQPVPPDASEVAALRQQVEALRAEMVRAAALPAAQPAAAPRTGLRARALVIGNGAYSGMGPLANPRRDAQAIAAKLRQFGIDVDIALDASRSQLARALAEFQERAAGYDVNILFYAGHGLQLGGINYLVPVDLEAAGATSGSIKLNAVSLNDALEYLPARTRVVFLDACRDNPLARSLQASTRGVSMGLAPVATVSGTLVAYATRDGSTAEDGRGRNSPYTTALLEHLDAPDDIAVVLRRVRQSVLKATSQRQEPWEYGSLVGDQLVLSRLAR